MDLTNDHANFVVCRVFVTNDMCKVSPSSIWCTVEWSDAVNYLSSHQNECQEWVSSYGNFWARPKFYELE